MQSFLNRLAIAAVALAFGGFSIWLVRPSLQGEIDALAKQALCTLDLAPGAREVSAQFTLTQSAERFHIGLRPGADDEPLRITVLRGGIPVFQATLSGTTRFGGGRNLSAGTYTAVLGQVSGTQGGFAAISDRGVTPRITGWQVYAGCFTALMLASGILALFARRFGHPRQFATSYFIFQNLSLAFIGMFMYLLFHEGGHSLGELAFGRYDFARSDFWGIHGSPHSGGGSGPALQPWQHAVISGGGILAPTFAGWVLYLLWICPIGRQMRVVRPILSLYYDAVLGMALLPSIALAGCLLGVMSDGDWYGFITNVPGPPWLVRGLLWGSVLVNGGMLWRVVPEFVHTWNGQFSGAGGKVR